MTKRALITGVTGQLGSYLAEFLLEKDYQVFGLVRRSSVQSVGRILHLYDKVKLINGDLTDTPSIEAALRISKPHEVYNCAAQSQVGTSFIEPLHTADVTGLGALRLFEAVRTHTSASEHVKVYHSSSSEMFGLSNAPQTEDTPLHPDSPYACAKAFAHMCAQMYSRAYGLFIACGVNFNFESPRRGEEFVTRKVTRALGRIATGQQSLLRLGNLAARRDWSHAKDVARAAWLMLQQPRPDSYVIASGVSHTVKEFVETAFNLAGLDWQKYVVVDPVFQRPLDVAHLEGCANKAKAWLKWEPTITFLDLVKEMVTHDLQLAETESRDSVRAAG